MKIEKVKKLAANLHDKKRYVIQIKDFKESSNVWLVFKKLHRAIKFNQNAWLKPYIDMKAELGKKA